MAPAREPSQEHASHLVIVLRASFCALPADRQRRELGACEWLAGHCSIHDLYGMLAQ